MFEALFAHHGLSLDRLRTLCEVAEAGSITQAAGGDPVRQSQFSRQIRELESFFEVSLTRRDGKGLALTLDGLALVRAVRQALTHLDDFRLQAGGQPVLFALGAGDSLIRWLVLSRLPLLRKALPDLRLRLENLRTPEIVQALRDMKIDFGLVRPDAVTKPLTSIPLGRMKYTIFCPRRLLKDNRQATAKVVLARVPFVLQSGEGAFARVLRNWVDEAGASRAGQLECDSFPQACRAVATGQFAAVLPRLAAGELGEDEYLQVDVPHFNKNARGVALAWNPRTLDQRGGGENVLGRLRELLKMK